MVIVESNEQFNEFTEILKQNPSVVIPVMTDEKAHPAVNGVCLLFVWVNNTSYVLPFDHNEAQNLPKSCWDHLATLTTQLVFTPDKKVLCHLSELGRLAVDIKGIEFLKTGNLVDSETFYPPSMRQLLSMYRNYKNVFKAVPLMQLVGFFDEYLGHLRQFVDFGMVEHVEGFHFHNYTVIPACWFMERSGVSVNGELFAQYYGEKSRRNIVNGLVYTNYNPYTRARRVSNSHNGINYAAIEKKTGNRLAFTTRNNFVVLIDWESFHLRLIADLMGYDLPAEPIHEFLAKQYFNTDTVTPEQYDEGKQITFKNLYGQGDSQIEFFQKVRTYVDLLWETINTDGKLTTDHNELRLDRIELPNPGKVFNYLLQLRETEVALTAVRNLMPIFEGKKSKVTLYTYDSLLIDLDRVEAKTLLPEVVTVLEANGKYPVRLYAGPNYDTLNNVTNYIKSNSR